MPCLVLVLVNYAKRKERLIEMAQRCMFWKGGKCNSDYGHGIKCDGNKNFPKNCPYIMGD